jgi:hypothetical protein
LRAFGLPQAPFPDRVDGPRAVETAVELGVVERIGARIPSELLVAELGREAAQHLAMARLQVLANVRGLRELIPELASVAAAAGIPIVLLKFAALQARGCLAEGSRAAGDVDVLLREGDAERLAEILTGHGFHAPATTLADHHLPPLLDGDGRMVELHTRLPGVRPPGSARFAGFDALEAAGGLEPAPGLGEHCFLPRRDLMAAYAVAHALAHHGGADAYPVSRMLADVIDVLPGDRRAPWINVREWIAADVPGSAMDAVTGLCDALEKGELDGLAGPEEALLRHVLAGSLDPEYRRSLAVGFAMRPLTDGPRWRRFLKTVQWKAFPTKTQVAAQLGLPNVERVTLRLRLAPSIALAKRLPRLAGEALRVTWLRLTGAARKGPTS